MSHDDFSETLDQARRTPPGASAALNDIPGGMQADAQVQESHQRIVNILETMPAAFIALDTKFRLTFVNATAERLMRKSRQELIGKELWREFPEAVGTGFYTAALKAMNERAVVEFQEFYPPFKSWFEVHAYPVAEGLSVYFQDVTGRKQMEEALRESEERFKAFMDNSPAVAFMKDEQGRYVYINRPFERLFNVRVADIRGKTDFDYWPEKTVKPLREHDALVLSTGKAVEVIEAVPTPDGTPHHWLVFKFPFQDSCGRRFVGGVAIDITERKRAEEALRESEDRYRDLVENSGILFGTHDLEGKILSVNQATLRLSGYERAEELLGQKVSDFLAADVRHQFSSYLETVVEKGHARGFMKVLTRSREERILEYDNSLRTEGLAKPIVRCIGHDVTERKGAEEALRESEERYRSVIISMQEGIVIRDTYGAVRACNPSAERILGVSAEQMLGTTTTDPRLLVIHEDGSPFPGEMHPTMVTLRTGKPCSNVIMGFPQPDRTVTWISVNSQPMLRAGEKTPYAVVASFSDITERKRAEQISRSQTAALTRTLNLLAAEPALDTFLGHVLRAITEQLNAPSSGLYLQDAGTETAPLQMAYQDGRVLCSSGEAGHPLGSFPKPTDREDPLRLFLSQSHCPLVIQDVSNSPLLCPETRSWASAYGIKTVLLVPLLLGDKLIGTLSVYSREHRSYRPEEKELAQALAHQATLAVQLTRLAEQGQRSVLLQERNRIAQEIHDTLAQGFTGIVLQLEAAEDALAEKTQEARKHIFQARRLARESLAEARRSVWALRPQRLEHGDLPAAVKSLVDQLTQDTAIQAEFALRGTPRRLAREVESNLLRISQEALTNALRHAQANKVQVEVAFSPHRVQLRVQDDGKGFDPHQYSAGRGFGLTSMRERAERLGGHLRIRSRAGQGAKINVIVPAPPGDSRE